MPGFNLIEEKPGVTLYSNERSFIQSVDLSSGAAIKLLYGDSNLQGKTPVFKTQSNAEAWTSFKAKNDRAFSLVNGQFFDKDESETQLSYHVKVDGKVISLGNNFGDDKYLKTIEIFSDKASITKFNRGDFENSILPAQNAIAGFNSNLGTADGDSKTFLGVKDSDFRDGNETILIFSTAGNFFGEKDNAKQLLEKFGAQDIIIMDSGGSPFLQTQQKQYVSVKNRKVPQTTGVIESSSFT